MPKRSTKAGFGAGILTFALKNGVGMADAQLVNMMTALFVWMGVSAITTFGIVSALALGVRRHIPTITDETGAESIILVNRGQSGASGEAKLAHSLSH